MTVIYDILYAVFYLLYMPILILKGKWHRGLLHRFGFFPAHVVVKLKNKPNIWFHAVSVGEVQAVLGLIGRFQDSFVQYQPVVTTVTKTGYQLARTKLPSSVVVAFAPLDFSRVVKKYVQIINPRIYITAETEVWPNLFRELAIKNIPNLLVNGRISKKSFMRYYRFRNLFKGVFRNFSHCCVQTDSDAQRLMQLGVHAKRISVVGNMKFDEQKLSSEKITIPDAIGQDYKIWIAGSTHPQEEEIMLRVYKELSHEYRKLRLVIAPRHIERTKEIERLIRHQKLDAILYSKNPQTPLKTTDVLLVDTIGHLRHLYRYASVVFIGKSLKGRGGQNIIEPAFFAKPIIIGPHMENFLKIVDIFKNADAILQISDEIELKNAISDILRFPAKSESLGLAAYNIVLSHQGATTKTLEQIAKILASKTY